MEKQFFIFIGRSGGGKGTQALLLKEYLENKGHSNVQHITTGGGFREFIEQDNYIAHKAKEVYDDGGPQPEFLAVWVWSKIFINLFKGDETVILDGAPRKPFEVNVLHSAITFLDYKNPVVVYLDVSESVSRDHIQGRGRSDDVDEKSVDNKMNWFDVDIIPTIEMYLQDPRYKVLHINGNQTVDDVHKEIIEKLESVQ